MLETNGSSQAQGEGARIVLRTLDGPIVVQAIKLAFTISNNEAKYEAVILGLRVAKRLSIAAIELQCDSQLVASQLQGKYEVKNEMMEQYLWIAKPLMVGFKHIQVTHVPRSENQMVEALANLATNVLYPFNVELSVMDQSCTLATTVMAID